MRSSFLGFALILALSATSVSAAEKIVPESSQKNLNVTIYNANRALIKDTRAVQLENGLNTLSFTGVSSQIIPQSALLQGTDLKTQEQNFNFDVIDYNSLMEKSVGSQVGIEYIDPATGAVSSGTAELLAFNGGSPVLKIGNKIETNYPGRIIFNKVPDNLRVKPTLTIDVLTQTNGTQNVDLSYLTQGLSWRADYVAELNNNEDKLNLNGLVTLTNNSNTDFKNAHLQLVAGDVNIVPVNTVMARKATGYMLEATVASDAMASESFSDFYLYTLPRTTDILSQQTKQVSLLSGQNVSLKKTYEFNNQFNMYADKLENISPEIFISFDNKKDNGLGVALPKGIIRLYKSDSSGNMLLIGEDRIQHTPNGETVRLKTGKAFDLTADMKRTQYQKLTGKNAFQATYQIILKNGSSNPANVEITQDFGNSFRITNENIPHFSETSNQVKWIVPVPANGMTTLTYELTKK